MTDIAKQLKHIALRRRDEKSEETGVRGKPQEYVEWHAAEEILRLRTENRNLTEKNGRLGAANIELLDKLERLQQTMHEMVFEAERFTSLGELGRDALEAVSNGLKKSATRN